MNNNDMALRLHPTLGVNAKLTFCRRCGKDGNELLLIGAYDSIRKCNNCKIELIGFTSTAQCPKCKQSGSTFVRTIGEYEKLPSNSLCDTCQKEVDEHKALVEAGGVYFKCKECNNTGVIKPSPLQQLLEIVQMFKYQNLLVQSLTNALNTIPNNMNIKETIRYKCDMITMDIMQVERKLSKLKQHPQVIGPATVKSEMQSNIMLAYRHLEDACSRVGRIG